MGGYTWNRKPTGGISKAAIDDFVKEGEFIYGNLIENNGKPYIVGDVTDVCDDYISLEYWAPVHFETVGRWSGETDKNGVRIYQQDLVNYDDGFLVRRCYVDLIDWSWSLVNVESGNIVTFKDLIDWGQSTRLIEVIGYVFEDEYEVINEVEHDNYDEVPRF